MENYKINKKVIIICLCLVIVFLFFSFLFKNRKKTVGEEEYEYLEKYESNQFVPVTVTKNDMAFKYLNDYKNLLISDLKKAYSLLNNEYKQKRFPTYEEFTNYIKDKYSLAFYGTTVEKYRVINYDGNCLYYVYDSNGDLYIFNEKNIMDYEVYLDDYTIEFK